MISIVDYGMGNLRSVQKALEHLGHSAEIVTDPDAVRSADKLILPGVGAFRDAIAELHHTGLVEPLREYATSGKPFLGICLGMQLLLDISHEEGEHAGLGLIAGEVVRFEDAPGLKIPHMGWNRLKPVNDSPLLAGLPDEAFVYFVHSYHVVPERETDIVARTDHGIEFVSVLQRDNLFATQFHPEKSQAVGLKILRNFAEM